MNQYLVYGFMLPFKESEKVLDEKYGESGKDELFDKYYDSAFDKKITEVDGCSLISDGMNGGYNFFGKIFQKSEVHEPLMTSEFPKVSSKIKKNVEAELLKVFGSTLDVKPKVFLLTHYR